MIWKCPDVFLERAVIPVLPLWSIRIDHHLSDFARPQLAAAIKFAIEDQSTSNAGAESDADDIDPSMAGSVKAIPQ